MKQRIYMAYGTDMASDRMKRICPDACLIGCGLLPDYKLTFKYKGLTHIEPAQGETVPVMLWQVSDNCEKMLDFYHKLPKMRKKVEVQIRPEDPETAVSGYTYVMKDEYAQYVAAPSSEDYNCLFEVYVNNLFELSALPTAYEEALHASVTP